MNGPTCPFCGHPHFDGEVCGHPLQPGMPCICKGHPMANATPASEKMPYGWVSPRYGSRGWLGAVLQGLVMGLLFGLTPLPFFWIIPFGVLLLVGSELLRTDSIQMHGAVTFEYLEKGGVNVRDLYWSQED